MLNYVRTGYRKLTSPVSAIAVFVAVTLASLAGAAMDSDYLMSYAPGISSELVFKGTWFVVLNLLLLLIILLCTARQVKVNAGRWRRFLAENAWADTSQADSASFPADPPSLQAHIITGQQEVFIRSVLTKQGYQVRGNENGSWTGRKNKAGFIASPLFHLGLAIVLLGAVVDVFAGFSGEIPLRPGVAVNNIYERSGASEEGRFHPRYGDSLQLTLDSVKIEAAGDSLTSSGVLMVLRNGFSSQAVVDGRTQLNAGLFSFARGKHGYYVYYRIFDGADALVDHAQGLNTSDDNERPEYSIADYSQPGTPYRLTMNFIPDAPEKRPYKTLTYDMKNPALELKAEFQGKTVFNGLVKQEQEVTMSNGHRFLFRGAVPYLMVRVQWLLGAYTVAIGFVLFLAGMVLYYFCQPSVIYVKPGEQGYEVDYRAWAGRETVDRQVQELVEKLNGKGK